MSRSPSLRKEQVHDEKLDETRIEDAESTSSVDAEFERQTMRKVDIRLLPILGLCYSISLIDRTNLSVARVAGMGDALGLKIGARYSIVSFIYFVPYVLLQLPLNVVLRRLGPKRVLSFYVVAWGAVQVGMAFVPTWGLLILCRVLLGVFEAGFFPGMVFIISTWYKRHEVQSRLAFFYLVAIFIGGFSNVIAFGIQKLNGKAHLGGWQWIFLLEGIATMLLGVIAYAIVSDFPDRNHFLTEKQTKLVLDRVEQDRGDSMPDEMTTAKIMHHLKDWTIWASGLMFMGSTCGTYAMAFFIPVILNSMGWGTEKSLLMSAPPFVVASISSFLFSLLSDKVKKRAIFIVIQTLMTILGLLLAIYVRNNGVRYFGLFLTNVGATGCLPSILAYNSNNVVSHSKRAVSTAMVIAFGGIGGIFGTTVFRQQDAPGYLNGMWATIGSQLMLLTCLAATYFTYARRNRLAREGKLSALEGQPGFYYTL